MDFITGIVATNPLGVIGKNGDTPWKYPGDMKHFRKTTMGSACVMGHKTWDAIPEEYRPLEGRMNIVMSRTLGREDIPGAIVLPDVDAVVSFAAKLGQGLYVIGGGEIYAAFAKHYTNWIVTEVPDLVEGADTFLPEDFLDSFEMEDVHDLGTELLVRHYRRISDR